jgi:signal transduction histidine kinase
MAMYAAGRVQCEIEKDLEGLPALARLDEGLIYRAISNLVTNAIKYRIESDAIRIIGRRIPAEESRLGVEALRIAVENRSRPFAEDELKGIFNRFQRGNSASGIEGTGIGLYVVHAAVKAHGGLADAEWIRPDRVRFYIEFPLVVGPKSPPKGPYESTGASGGATLETFA